MLGLLVRVVIGIVAAGAAGAAGYAVYKLLTRDTVKEEINEMLEDRDSEVFKKAFAAKVKKKQNESITVDILDEWEEPIATDMEVEGDEVSDEIHVGDIISLVD